MMTKDIITFYPVGNMNVCAELAIHQTAVEIFHSEQKNVNLMVALEEKSKGKVIGFHPLGMLNICTKCHSKTSNIYGDILVWIKVVDQPTDRHCHPLSPSISEANNTSQHFVCFFLYNHQN